MPKKESLDLAPTSNLDGLCSPESLYEQALEMARKASPDMPEAPKWIGKWGKLEWYELGQCLHNEGLFRGHLDYSLFAKYCNQHDTYVEVCRAISREGKIIVDTDSQTGYGEPNPKLKMVDILLKNIIGMISKFGVSPMGRNSLDMANAPKYNRLKAELGIETVMPKVETRGRKPKGYA